MKNIMLLSIAFLCLSANLLAQNTVQLNINHKLGLDYFAIEQTATTDSNEDFQLSRVEYYISQISIIHDGGTETMIPDTWLLIDANTNSSIDLGSFNITAVEKINFHIGIEEALNHEDPSLYDTHHPLAPQNPSMHWGWVGGYRFVALEGNAGDNMTNEFNMHGLGDENYFMQSIELQNSLVTDNTIYITLDADYIKALQGISVQDGVISHGEDGEALTVLENFRDHVFTEGEFILTTADISSINSFEIYPNPTTSRQANIFIDAENDEVYEVVVSDLLGKTTQRIQGVRTNTTLSLDLPTAGLHLVSLMKDGQLVSTQKVVAY